LEIGGTVRPDHAGDLVAALCRELTALVRTPPSADELARICARYARDLEDSLDDPAAVAEAVGKGILFGDPFRPTRSLALLRRVRGADVRRLAASVVADPALCLLLSGKVSRAALADSRRAIARIRRV
ncbi:MAG TPA: hypothetical protein VGO62_15045, partial [Myxococcota bacterium]